MWQPTHVKVTVKQAHGLIAKGKNGTNDAFVVIGIGKEKFQTSIKEKSLPNVEWKEECELEIPSQGNKANIQLTVYHQNALGYDEFLGQVALPLSEFDIYEKPKYRWYRLKGKPEKDKKKGEKERGDLEVMVNFTVKSETFLDSKKEKHKSSLSSLKHLGGSLLSLGGKEKQGLKNFAKSVSSKMDKIAKPKKNKHKSPSESSNFNDLRSSEQYYGEADPGVISDDDDFRFEDDVKIGTRTSSPMSTMSRGSSLVQEQVLDTDYDAGSYDDREHDFSLNFGISPPKPPRIVDETRETLSPHDTYYPVHSGKITSFSDPKPSITVIGPTPPRVSQTIIEEEPAFIQEKEDEEPEHFRVYKRSSSKLGRLKTKDLSVDGQGKFDSIDLESENGGSVSTVPSVSSGNYSSVTTITSDVISSEDKQLSSSKLHLLREQEAGFSKSSNEGKVESLESPAKRQLLRDSAVDYGDSRSDLNGKEDGDSAISVGNDQDSTCSSSQVSIHTNSAGSPSIKTKLKIIQEEQNAKPKRLLRSTSELDCLLRSKENRRRDRRVVSVLDNILPREPDMVRSMSMNKERSSVPVEVLVAEQQQQASVVDEWERKLYGRLGMTGSTENMSRSDSRSSLNTSRESSVHDIPRDDSFTRLPEVEALTLDDKEDGKKQKKKGKIGFRNRFFGSKLEGVPREKMNGEGRVVEGGNDRLPTIPSKAFKLPQEVHDKFAGKSREDLLEMILHLQADLEAQVKHSTELEEYIDNLLLRVMEATPHILQAPLLSSKTPKYSFGEI